jgi:hypothetical protein
MDEGIARTDRGGALDVFGTYAPDGVLGPRGEKEGSYHTIREIWSPVQIAAPDLGRGFDGRLQVKNNYDFTSLAQVRFRWQLLRFAAPDADSTAATVLQSGHVAGPAIPAHGSGQLKLALPKDFAAALSRADALVLDASGPSGEPLWTWTWPVSGPTLPAALLPAGGATPRVSSGAEGIRLGAGDVVAAFDADTGLLRAYQRGQQAAPLTAGPRLVYAKASKLPVVDLSGIKPAGDVADLPWTALAPAPQAQFLATPQMANVARIALDFLKTDTYVKFKLEVSADGQSWHTLFDAARRSSDGDRYSFPPQLVKGIRVSQPVSEAGRLIPLRTIALGYEAERFPPPPQPARITTGSDGEQAWFEADGAGGLQHVRWTLRRDGALKLEYRYDLSGDYVYHGVTFDQTQEGLRSMKRLADGPSRVWQNRLRGTGLMVSETPYRAGGPVSSGDAEFQGYFGNLRWVRFDSSGGPLLVNNGSPGLFLRVGTPQLGHIHTSMDFPPGDLSFLAAIPAMGSKMIAVGSTGPSSQAAKAAGTYQGTLLFSLP